MARTTKKQAGDTSLQYRLSTQIGALEAAGKALAEARAESVATIRRIASSLRDTLDVYELSSVAASVGAVLEAPDADIEARLGELLRALRAARSGTRTRSVAFLIVDDDPDAAEFIQACLKAPGRKFLVAASGSQALQLCDENRIGVVVLDLLLPDMDGRNLLMKLRGNLKTAAVPIIVLSALSSTPVRVECLALGADEFLEKPVNPDLLSAAIAARLHHSTGVMERARADPLTGLLNRAAFGDVFGQASAQAEREKKPLSLAILDLDHFKSVNDTHGHAMGDEVLRRVAGTLSGALRGSDVLGRWGGEEFVILFPNTDLNGAALAMENALRSVRALRFQSGELSFQVTFSAGVSSVAEGVALEDAVAAADAYLYQAKSAGRNSIHSSATLAPVRQSVLVAEDDPVNAHCIRRYLEHDGFDVEHCADGAKALAALGAQRHYALVILDLLMPEAHGFEVLERLRQMPARARTPVIILTATNREADIVRAFNLGADDYIVKPFSHNEFLARIHRLLKRR